jgi:hypothetical protein
MLNSLPLRGVLVIFGSALALTAATLPAQAATTGWRASATFSVKGEEAIESGIAAVAGNDAWAVGAAATSTDTKDVFSVEHWAGKSWKRVTLPSKVAKVAAGFDFLLSGIAASSSTNVWVFGEVGGLSGGDSYLRLNGKTWSTGTLPGSSDTAAGPAVITAAVALSKSDVWVFGAKPKPNTGAVPTYVPYAAQFNGHSWTTKPVPGAGEIQAASAISPSDIWAVTGASEINATSATSKPSVLHWNGTSWKASALPTKLPAGAELSAVVAKSDGDVWIAGAAISGSKTKTQFADEFTGSKWADAPTDLKSSASSQSCEPVGIVPAGSGLWAASSCTNGASKLWHFSGSAWSSPESPKFGGTKAGLLQLAAVPGTSSVWAVGAVEVHNAEVGLIGIDGPTPD